MPRGRTWDESDVRVRPSRRGSRPRTKHRPAHDDAEAGWVRRIDRGRYSVLVPPPSPADDHATMSTTVTAVRAREIRPRDIAVGDRVRLVGDTTGLPGTLARLVGVDPRSSALRRTADDTDPFERVVVANADQVCVVMSGADPPPTPRLVDRALVAAWDAGIDPLLVVTKTDLTDPGALVAAYGSLGVPTLGVTSRGWEGLDAVRRAVRGRVTVLVGPSGVGKSTLVNVLSPGAERVTAEVSATTGKGRHTSTSAVLLPLRDVGWVVDTPGIRSFGLAHVTTERVLAAFDDLAPGAAECPRGCTHTEPGCALDAWVAAGAAGGGGPERLDSLRRLLSALQE